MLCCAPSPRSLPGSWLSTSQIRHRARSSFSRRWRGGGRGEGTGVRDWSARTSSFISPHHTRAGSACNSSLLSLSLYWRGCSCALPAEKNPGQWVGGPGGRKKQRSAGERAEQEAHSAAEGARKEAQNCSACPALRAQFARRLNPSLPMWCKMQFPFQEIPHCMRRRKIRLASLVAKTQQPHTAFEKPKHFCTVCIASVQPHLVYCICAVSILLMMDDDT